MPALRRNLEGIATVLQAAVTYEKDVALLNAVYPQCVSTGGSTLIDRQQLSADLAAGKVTPGVRNDMPSEYWADLRPIRTLTLEDLLERFHADRIDVLKLDCEGSEFSILENTTSLDRIALIIGEYHGRERFQKLVQDRFGDWTLRILNDAEIGTFWLTNPRLCIPDDLSLFEEGS